MNKYCVIIRFCSTETERHFAASGRILWAPNTPKCVFDREFTLDSTGEAYSAPQTS